MDSKYTDDHFVYTGVEIIDDQHQVFFNLIDKLQLSSGPTDISYIIDEMHLYSLYHFETEEKILKKYNPSCLDAHVKKHQNFINKIEQFRIDYTLENSTLIDNISAFMGKWLVEHIKNTDLADLQHIKKKFQED